MQKLQAKSCEADLIKSPASLYSFLILLDPQHPAQVCFAVAGVCVYVIGIVFLDDNVTNSDTPLFVGTVKLFVDIKSSYILFLDVFHSSYNKI